MNPMVSVIMPARNEARYVGEAVQSILDQSYPTWELVLVDGSTDRTVDIVRGFRDSRIRVVKQRASGFVTALNQGLAAAKGEMIARLDADDLAHPRRLELEVEYLEAHSTVGMVGSASLYLFPDGARLFQRVPTGNRELRRALLRDNPFVHSSVMIRREVLEQVGGYDARYPDPDYDMWVRIAARFDVANLPEPLVSYRIRLDGISRNRSLAPTLRKRLEIQRKASQLLGPRALGAVYAARSCIAIGLAVVTDATGLSRPMVRRRLKRLRRQGRHRAGP